MLAFIGQAANNFAEDAAEQFDSICDTLEKLIANSPVSDAEKVAFVTKLIAFITFPFPKAQAAAVLYVKISAALRRFVLGKNDQNENFMHLMLQYNFKLSLDRYERIVNWALAADAEAKTKCVRASTKKTAKGYIYELLTQFDKQGRLPHDIAFAFGNMDFVRAAEAMSFDDLGQTPLKFIYPWTKLKAARALVYAIQNKLKDFEVYLFQTDVVKNEVLKDQQWLYDIACAACENKRFDILQILLKQEAQTVNLSTRLFDEVLKKPVADMLVSFIVLMKVGFKPSLANTECLYQKILADNNSRQLMLNIDFVRRHKVKVSAAQSMHVYKQLVNHCAKVPANNFDQAVATMQAFVPWQSLPAASQLFSKAEAISAKLNERFNIETMYRPGLFRSFGYTRTEKMASMTKLLAALLRNSNSDPEVQFDRAEIRCLLQATTGNLMRELFPGITVKNFVSMVQPNIQSQNVNSLRPI